MVSSFAEAAVVMVERRPALTFLSHLILVLGVIVVGFPVYVTLIASTQTSQEIVQHVPMSMVPGGHMLETYGVALFGGTTSYGSRVAPVASMMWVSLVTALAISIGKIAISLLSAFAFVYFRFPLRNVCFWMVFVTLMLPVEVRIGPAPSMRAASTSSSGTVRKNWRNRNVAVADAISGTVRPA